MQHHRSGMARPAIWAALVALALLAACGGSGGGSPDAPPAVAPVRDLTPAGTLSLRDAGSVTGVAASGRVIYIASPRGLLIVDARALSAPTMTMLPPRPSSFPNPYDAVWHVAAEGSLLAIYSSFECYCLGMWGNPGLDTFDVSDPVNLRRLAGPYISASRDVQIQGGSIYVSNREFSPDHPRGDFMLDAARPSASGWTIASTLSRDGGGGIQQELRMAAAGPLLAGSGRLLVPFATSPTTLGFDEYNELPSGAFQLRARSAEVAEHNERVSAVEGGGRLFWVAGYATLMSVRRDALTAPPVVVQLPAAATSVAWQAGSTPTLWVALGSAGVAGYDVADPARPRLVARMATPEPAWHVSIHDGYGVVITARTTGDAPPAGSSLLERSTHSQDLHVFALP